MDKATFVKILESEEVINNIELKKELEYLLSENRYGNKIWRFPKSLSIVTYQYLLSNNYLTANEVFDKAFSLNVEEKHDELLDLALANKVDFASMYSLSSNISPQDLEKCFANGLSLDQAIKLILSSYCNNEKEISAQNKLIEYLAERGANFGSVKYYSLPKHFPKEIYELMLNHGLKADILFKTAIDLEPGEKHDELLDLALANNVDYASVSILSNISLQDLEKCLSNGLRLNRAAELVLNSFRYNEKEISSQIKLIEYLAERGANFGSVKYYSLPKHFPKEIYELMLNHGLKADILFKTAIDLEPGEKHDELLDLALANKVDFASMYSLSSNISPQDLEKCFANGLSLDQAIKLILSSYCNNEKEISAQTKLIEYLAERGANFGSVKYYSLPKHFPKEIYELMLKHGLKADILFDTAIDLEPGEKHDELLDLALANKVDFASMYYSLSSNISPQDLEKCFANGLNANDLLKFAINMDPGEKQDKFIEIALRHKADPNKITYLPNKSLNFALLEVLINNGLVVDNAFKLVINSSENKWDNARQQLIILDEAINLKQEVIAKLVSQGVNIDNVIEDIHPSMDYLNNNKEFIVTNFSADVLIKLIRNSFNKNQRAAELLEFGFKFGGRLENKSLDELYENKMHEFLLNPARIIEQKYKNLDAPHSDEAKMPYLMHHIWLTSTNNPREIRAQDIENAIKNKNIFANSGVKWSHIVWTNDKSLIPESVKILEENGIEVRSIYDYKDDLSLFNLIEDMVSKSKWGMASDTLRYVLVEQFGGVYADINFIFNRDVTEETHKYNFFTKNYGEHYIDNFYFGANAHHPVTQKMIELVERNMVNPPEYLANIKNPDSRILTDMGTANPTYIAYYLEANKNGNIDVVYPKTNSDNIRSRDVIFIEDRIDNWDLESKKYKNVIEKYFPEQVILINFSQYLDEHDICGIDYYNIGYDSPDGLTWVNK